jgi:large subunit ribosomal protein L30
MAETRAAKTTKVPEAAKAAAPKTAAAESKATTSAKATIQVQYYRSAIQAPVKHKRVVKGLGFTRLNQIVVREDTPSIRGMVRTVPHLVRIVE